MLHRLLCLALAANYAHAQTGQTKSEDPLTELSIEQLLDVQVETAALKKQSLRDAPADVTVITAVEIHRYGYRTLAEVLSNTRGFYMTQDGGFQYPGVRGFSLQGDFNMRFLVMINGHQLTDNVFSAMYMFGQDFGLDMDRVEQIEIVRGPSSALYGSTGVFATINIITKSAGSRTFGQMSTEIGSFGETKLLASATFRVGRTGRGSISGSAFHTGGRTGGLNTPDNREQLHSLNKVGKEQGYHSFATLSWNRWSFATMFGERRVSMPTGYFGSDVGDSGTRSLDARNFVEVAWHRPLGVSKALKWRAYYDQFRNDGNYSFLSSNYQQLNGSAGDWAGNQLLYQQENTRVGSITVGAEANIDIRNLFYDQTLTFTPAGPVRQDVLSIRHPNATYAAFIQNEWKPAAAWTVYLGGRFDASRNNPAVFSPRAAVVYTRNTSTYKVMYGRAFRNPSTFERYYTPNPDLAAERIHSIEMSREQQLTKRLRVVTSVFHYRLSGLIQGILVSETALQYRNSAKASATGLEMELNGHPFEWLDTTASFTLHRVRGIDDQHPLENSPVRIGQFRASVPFARERMAFAGAMRYISSRATPFGGTTPAATFVDLTATVRPASKAMDLQFGVRNLLDQQYSDPVNASAVLPRAGRSVYVKLTWRGE